jgi:hypothetical protein
MWDTWSDCPYVGACALYVRAYQVSSGPILSVCTLVVVRVLEGQHGVLACLLCCGSLSLLVVRLPCAHFC